MLISISTAYSQVVDKVFLKNKEVIEGKVIQVTADNIEINPKGNIPFQIIPRSSVSVLIYSDNTVVSFEKTYKSEDEIYKEKNKDRFYFDVEFITEFSDMRLFRYSTYPIKNYAIIYDSISKKNVELYIEGQMTANISSGQHIIRIKSMDLKAGIFIDGKDYSQNVLTLDGVAIFKKAARKATLLDSYGFNIGEYYIEVNVIIKNIEEYKATNWTQSKNRAKGTILVNYFMKYNY